MIKKIGWLLLFFSFISLGQLSFGKNARVMEKSPSIDLYANKSVYRAGEPVELTVIAANRSKTAIKLIFGSGQSFDLAVADENNNAVWQWSHDRVFTMAVRSVELLPGQRLKFNAVWRQADNNDQPVKRGKYFVRGWLTTTSQPGSQKKLITIK
ncbi:MAG: BsuPI-related putative proteinase inhibitor [Candidatus Margulisbacteria bacterium]|nr:BsuPI-related putative proteinase inhibitor [Candidatus Margulisiibacteriota bacterium]